MEASLLALSTIEICPALPAGFLDIASPAIASTWRSPPKDTAALLWCFLESSSHRPA
jgi:hypothetical protein